MTRIPALALAASIAVAPGTAAAQPPHKAGGAQPGTNVNIGVSVVFGPTDRIVIQDYYRQYPGQLPPGLAKRGSLPPGHQKQLAKTGRLPPGIEKKALPGPLVGRLPPIPRGYDRVIIGRDVVLIEISAQTIVDILEDVFN